MKLVEEITQTEKNIKLIVEKNEFNYGTTISRNYLVAPYQNPSRQNPIKQNPSNQNPNNQNPSNQNPSNQNPRNQNFSNQNPSNQIYILYRNKYINNLEHIRLKYEHINV